MSLGMVGGGDKFFEDGWGWRLNQEQFSRTSESAAPEAACSDA